MKKYLVSFQSNDTWYVELDTDETDESKVIDMAYEELENGNAEPGQSEHNPVEFKVEIEVLES